jgi:hypothetical protein
VVADRVGSGEAVGVSVGTAVGDVVGVSVGVGVEVEVTVARTAGTSSVETAGPSAAGVGGAVCQGHAVVSLPKDVTSLVPLQAASRTAATAIEPAATRTSAKDTRILALAPGPAAGAGERPRELSAR